MDLSLCAKPEALGQTKRGILRHPASVSAPGLALGSLPSVALSSIQAGLIVREAKNRIEKRIASTDGKSVKDSVPRVVVNGRFWVAIIGRF